MRQFNAWGLGLVALAGFGACSDGGNTTTDAPGKKIELAVAPLSLPGIDDACYNVRVTAGTNTVWEQGAIGSASPATSVAGDLASAKANGALCASTYGNRSGGDISYVGPCDSTFQTNEVTVWIENLYQPSGAQLLPSEWDNPYPPNGTGLTVPFACNENEDTQVTFNFVIMRDANQGFFDVAVNFANVFCSAKLDTCNLDGQTGAEGDINLMFSNTGGGLPGPRTKTAVLAFACSGGAEASGNINTRLFLDDINLTCASGTTILSTDAIEGNQMFPSSTFGLINWAVYRTEELLDCGGGPGSCNKLTWSVALALDPSQATGNNCVIKTSFTVGSGEDPALQFGNPYQSPGNTRYPVIYVNAPLTQTGLWIDDQTNGGPRCINADLDDNDGRFRLEYTAPAGDCFDNAYQPDGSPQTPDGATGGIACP